MAEVTNIADRLNRLNATVSAKRSAVQSRKREDWARVESEHPDHAAFIRSVTQLFGKSDRLRVTTADGEVILDSGRYV